MVARPTENRKNTFPGRAPQRTPRVLAELRAKLTGRTAQGFA
jgi:hypothetical protein